jgi:hypothetical protein
MTSSRFRDAASIRQACIIRDLENEIAECLISRIRRVAISLAAQQSQGAHGFDFCIEITLRVEDRKRIRKSRSHHGGGRRHRTIQELEQRIGELEAQRHAVC